MRAVVAIVLLVACTLLLGAAPLARAHTEAQPPIEDPLDPATTGRPGLRVTTNRDGLPQNTVTAIALDGDGYLWAGTQDGAAYFNGRRWTVVDMPNRAASNFIRTIYSQPNGALWFGTREGGAARLEDGEWSTLDTSSGLPGNAVRAILETPAAALGAGIWFATDAGLARLAGGAWSVVRSGDGLPSDRVTCLLESVDGSGEPVLWAGTERGLARLSRGVWSTVTPAGGSPNAAIQCLAETRERDGSVLWVGTSAGLLRLAGDEWSTAPAAADLPSSNISCLRATIAPDGSSVLWAGTDAGLARFARGQWSVIDARSGLPGNRVLSLLDARVSGGSATLFVGTLEGMARWELGLWSALDTVTGLPSNVVYSLLVTPAEAGLRLWVGTDEGLARYENGRWTLYDATSGLPHDRVMVLYASTSDGRAVWVGTSNGLGRFEDGRWTDFNLSSSLPDKGVRCVLETGPAGARTLWAGTYGGLARLDDGRWTVFKKADGLPNDGVLALLETETAGASTVWAGTYGGLARYDGGAWRIVDASTGFPAGGVRSLHLSTLPSGQRRLWAGTSGSGVAYVDPDDPAARWTVISETSAPALPNNVVYRIEEDASGRIYLTTNRGVARLTPRAPTAANEPAFAIMTFTTDDGLPNNECNAGASAVDPRGRIWVGTVGGAAVFDPSAEIADIAPSPLRIERSWLTAQNRTFASNATLAYDENQCAFEYALLDFFHEDAIRYRTQLVGLDAAPSAWTTDSKREFTNLPAGDYVFAVWARDHAGNEAGPVMHAFAVRAAPWRTWWAYALYGVAFWGLVWAAYRLRVRTLKRRNELLRAGIRERTAQIADKVIELEASERRALEEKQRAVEADRAKTAFLAKMSHELRTPLNAIIGFVQLMERDRQRAPADRENLAVVARSSENLLALIVDLLAVSKIEAGGATLEEHAFDLHRLLRGIEEMFGVEAHAKGLHFRFDLPADLPRYAWGDENKLRQVLIKVVANAVKYTQRGIVTMTMAWSDDRATFVVEDTGQGIPAEELERVFSPFVQGQPDASFQGGAGLGLTVARAFVGLMGGHMGITSEIGEGTVVTFDVHLALARGTEPMAEARSVVGLEPGQGSPRILVADDTWENRTLVARMLASVGFDVRETRTGDEALAIWSEWHPDLIWLDTRLPGIDGLAVAREIRRREGVREYTVPRAVATGSTPSGSEDADPDARRLTPDACKLVATTAVDSDLERTAIFDAGCDQCVVKPCSEAAVFEALATQLGVRYVFDEPRSQDEPYPSDAPLLPEHLADLPRALVEQLRKGVMEGDVEAASAAADRIRPYDEHVAQALRRMVRTYRFDEVQGLVDAMWESEVGDKGPA